jgi:hypothetical protein
MQFCHSHCIGRRNEKRPSFFFSAPAMAPLTVCGCHPAQTLGGVAFTSVYGLRGDTFWHD